MGIHTEIFISYGILVDTKQGEYIKTYFDNSSYESDNNGTDNTNNNTISEEFIKKIEFTADGYDESRNSMFIHLKSVKFELLNKRTGGTGGYGERCEISNLSQFRLTKEEIADIDNFAKFAKFCYEIILTGRQFKDVFHTNYVPGEYIYFRNL